MNASAMHVLKLGSNDLQTVEAEVSCILALFQVVHIIIITLHLKTLIALDLKSQVWFAEAISLFG